MMNRRGFIASLAGGVAACIAAPFARRRPIVADQVVANCFDMPLRPTFYGCCCCGGFWRPIGIACEPGGACCETGYVQRTKA